MKKNNASVLLFSLMIISIIIMMTEQMIRSVMVGAGFTKTMVNREHARMLALGGINIAIAQLTYNKDKKNESEKNKDKDKATEKQSEVNAESELDADGKKITPLQHFVFNLLSNLNRWQTFELDPKIDGIAGTVKICVTSEHGKININNAFDFKKQEFKKEFISLLGGLEIPGKLKPGEFFNKISEFLKKREKKLYDVSELLNVPGLEGFDADPFYDPPILLKKEGIQQNKSLALQDIFTIWTDDAKIDPLLLSDALCCILNIARPRADDAKKYKERYKKLAMEFKDDWGKDWDANWKRLEGVYGPKPKLLSNIKDILVEKFNPKVYSVLSYGRVGQIEQRVLAVIKEIEVKNGKSKSEVQNEKSNSNEQPDKTQGTQTDRSPTDGSSTEQKKNKKVFRIERIYWL